MAKTRTRTGKTASRRKTVTNKAKSKPKLTPIKMTANTRNLKEATKMLVANATIMRSELLTKLLNPGKDINHECGYPDDITIEDYKRMFKRNGAAKRVVRILPEETWAMVPEIFEKQEAEETEFEKVWKEIEKEKKIFHYLQRIDVLSGVGEFGLLLIGIDDGKELNEPVEGIDERSGGKTGKKEYKLLYLKPFDQGSVTVKTKEVDVSSPRYGYPVTYSMEFEGMVSSGAKSTKEVHWTRVIHIADGRESSEVTGTPRMEPVYNRLLDLRKILGGSGEMFWKGGFPGIAFESSPEPGDSPLDTDSLKDQMELYMSGMQRYLAMEGMSVKSLAPAVASPKEHVETHMRNVAISLGIPYRIFLGTEEAKLASAQDVKTWNKRVAQRQTNYVSPFVIRPLIDRLLMFGVLPEVKGYFIEWPDLNAPTDKDKAEVSKVQTDAMAKYMQGGVDALIPPLEYFTMILGMSIEDAKAIETAAKKWIGLEEKESKEESLPEDDVKKDDDDVDESNDDEDMED